MIFIGLGVLGFVLLFVSDLCGLREKCSYKYLTAFSGTFLIFVSSIIILTLGYNYELSLRYRLIGLILAVLFLLLTIYSIVYEVGKNNQDKKLITSGTYALNRHPGVLWLFLYYFFGSFFFADYMILIAGVVFTLVNILYVYLQERLIFRHIFDNYDEYIKSTPMILPNRSSVQRCLKTINGGEHEKLTRNA